MKFSDVCKLLNACSMLKGAERWFGYVNENGVFFSSKRYFNEVVKLLKEKSYIFIQRGKLTRYAVTDDLRIEISVDGIPMVSYLPQRHYSETPAPAECYRIHLVTPDESSPEIPDHEIPESEYIKTKHMEVNEWNRACR